MELTSTKREKTGKKVKEIRRNAEVPAVVYGNEIESTSISINLMAFQKLFKKSGETALIDLAVDNDRL
jgi:large subunit ribosomal protein L25